MDQVCACRRVAHRIHSRRLLQQAGARKQVLDECCFRYDSRQHASGAMSDDQRPRLDIARRTPAEHHRAGGRRQGYLESLDQVLATVVERRKRDRMEHSVRNDDESVQPIDGPSEWTQEKRVQTLQDYSRMSRRSLEM